jgi:restriction endonuclease S subunit
MKLEKMAFVRSGLVLGRKQAKDQTEYRYPLLNLRCIQPDGSVDTSLCETFHANEYLNPEYLTHEGDVVIRLTAPYTAVLITRTLEGFVIPSSFIVVRTKTDILLPEYLVWLLNSKLSKRQIYDGAATNMLGGIKPRFFAEVDIDPLPTEQQRAIAQLSALAQQEAKLLRELVAEKEKYYDLTINKIYNKMKRGN